MCNRIIRDVKLELLKGANTPPPYPHLIAGKVPQDPSLTCSSFITDKIFFFGQKNQNIFDLIVAKLHQMGRLIVQVHLH